MAAFRLSIAIGIISTAASGGRLPVSPSHDANPAARNSVSNPCSSAFSRAFRLIAMTCAEV